MFLKLSIFILLIVLPTTSHAEPTLYDFVVGGAIKALAKVYVKTSNLPKLKDKYIQKIAGMREDKFQKYYGKFYTVYKELPSDLKQSYEFKEKITKLEAIEKIKRVEKRDLIAMISKVPTEFIVSQTRRYTHLPQEQRAAKPKVNEIYLWHAIIEKV